MVGFYGDYNIRISKVEDIELTLSIIKRISVNENSSVSFPVEFDPITTNDTQIRTLCYLSGFKHIPSVCIPCKYNNKIYDIIVYYPGMEYINICMNWIELLESFQLDLLNKLKLITHKNIDIIDVMINNEKNIYELSDGDWCDYMGLNGGTFINEENIKMTIHNHFMSKPFLGIQDVYSINKQCGNRYMFNPTMEDKELLHPKYLKGVLLPSTSNDLIDYCKLNSLKILFGSGSSYL